MPTGQTAPPPVGSGRGRGAVIHEGSLVVHEGPASQIITPPKRLSEFHRPHLSSDGVRIGALLREGQDVFAWFKALPTSHELLIRVPVAVPPSEYVPETWSADGSSLAVITAETQVWMISQDGRMHEVSYDDGRRIVNVVWRESEEITFVTTAGDLRGPYLDAVVWRMRFGEAPRVLHAGPLGSAGLSWSPDASDLGVIGLDGRDPVVHLIGPGGVRTVLTRADLRQTGPGCTAAQLPELQLSTPRWHPGGRLISIRGGGSGDSYNFVAFRWLDRDLTKAFGIPVNCPLFDVAWSVPRVFLNLTGPECGATELLGRLIVLSAEDASLEKEITIGRKDVAFVAPDGQWAVTSQHGVTFIPIARPDDRTSLPAERLIQWWCC